MKFSIFWSRSKVYLVKVFSLTVFFFGGSDPSQISGSIRFGSRQTGQTSGNDVIGDVTLRWRLHVWRVWRVYACERKASACKRVRSFGACGRAWIGSCGCRIFWRRVVVRGSSFGLGFLVFCRSGHAGSPGVVRFLKSWVDLHSFEGLSRWSSRVCGGAW